MSYFILSYLFISLVVGISATDRHYYWCLLFFLVIYLPYHVISLLALILLVFIDTSEVKSQKKADVKILDIKRIFNRYKESILMEELYKKPPKHQVFEKFFIEALIINMK